MVTSEQIKDFQDRLNALVNYLDINVKRKRVEEDEKITQQPNFWDDPKKAELFLKAINKDKIWVTEFDNLKLSFDDFSILFEFFSEGDASEQEVMSAFDQAYSKLKELEFKNMLSYKSWSWRNGKPRLGRNAHENVYYVRRKKRI